MAGFEIISGLDSSGNPVAARADGGVLSVSSNGSRTTFRYTAIDITPVATATDVLVLKGSASKVIRLTKVTVMGSATASAIYDAYLVKRTAANTGGTSTNPSATTADSSDPAQSGTVVLYSANPSALGTGTTMEAAKIYLGTAAITSPQVNFIWGNRNDKAPMLRGTSESLAINFNGAAVPTGASMYLTLEWTEDTL